MLARTTCNLQRNRLIAFSRKIVGAAIITARNAAVETSRRDRLRHSAMPYTGLATLPTRMRTLKSETTRHEPAMDETLEPFKSETRDGMRIDWDVPIPMEDGIVLRADLFRPIDDGKHPGHSLLRSVRQGTGVPGRQQERVGPHDRGVSRGRRGLDLQVPGLGGRRSGEMGAGRLCVPAHRCARRRPLSRIPRSVVAARDAGHLPVDRMGGGAAVVQRQGRDERHLLFRDEPMVCRPAPAAAPGGDLRVGRRGRLVSRGGASRRHLLRLFGQSLSARVPSRATRIGRARLAQPGHRRAGVGAADA